MLDELTQLVTEGRNPNTLKIDQLNSLEIVKLLNQEDKQVALAVEAELPAVARAVDLITAALRQGGRLFYVGAGTSGRLGVLDAAECPPTFGVAPDLVQGIIAGGEQAILQAVESVEDRAELGSADLHQRGLMPEDVVVGIAASGCTPYVLGALQEARRVGAKTIAVSCNPDSPLAALADVAISPVVGPEAIMGSTRLKAGTAQKLVLNMLSTASMIQLGKVFSNLMVDLQATNAKLASRSLRIVRLATGCSEQKAVAALAASENRPKLAIVMILTDSDAERARRLLDEASGEVRKAILLSTTEMTEEGMRDAD